MSYYSVPPPPLGLKLRLYNVPMNPYGHRVQLILHAKRVQYETVQLEPPHLPAWFTQKSPRLKIPLLEVPTDYGDRVLFESVVICDYLDEKYPWPPLHSRDPYRKAQDRLLVESFNELIKGMLECLVTKKMECFGSKQILSTVTVLERELEERGTDYLSGGRPGMLDYMIWPWLERLYLFRCVNEKLFDSNMRRFPNLADWGELMRLDEAVKMYAQSPREYYEYYRLHA